MNKLDEFLKNEEVENLAKSCKTTVKGLSKAVVKYEFSVKEIRIIADLVSNYQTKIFTVAKLLENHSMETISSALEVRNGVCDIRDEKGRVVCYKPSLKCLVEYIELFHEEDSVAEDILGEMEEFGLYDGARMSRVVKIAKEENVTTDIGIVVRLISTSKKRDLFNDPLLLNDPDHEEDDFKFNVVEGKYESL